MAAEPPVSAQDREQDTRTAVRVAVGGAALAGAILLTTGLVVGAGGTAQPAAAAAQPTPSASASAATPVTRSTDSGCPGEGKSATASAAPAPGAAASGTTTQAMPQQPMTRSGGS
ncbi:hypothetical protein OG440_39590 (plasmid) [Streptomyces sp. NBC_00637]|uniref:hypothetical protein n=1 Tax=Streptomyces sp. NBC_00637 TaxID=2903667 RepID=UPI003249683A